jgi:hypothetical protein
LMICCCAMAASFRCEECSFAFSDTLAQHNYFEKRNYLTIMCKTFALIVGGR